MSKQKNSSLSKKNKFGKPKSKGSNFLPCSILIEYTLKNEKDLEKFKSFPKPIKEVILIETSRWNKLKLAIS